MYTSLYVTTLCLQNLRKTLQVSAQIQAIPCIEADEIYELPVLSV